MRKEIMQALQQEYEQQRLKNSQEDVYKRQERQPSDDRVHVGVREGSGD